MRYQKYLTQKKNELKRLLNICRVPQFGIKGLKIVELCEYSAVFLGTDPNNFLKPQKRRLTLIQSTAKGGSKITVFIMLVHNEHFSIIRKDFT